MAYPDKPDLDYSYTGFQQAQGDDSFPGTSLDGDLANLKASVDATIDFIQTAIRSDGALSNGIVTVDSLDTTLAAALGDVDSIAYVEAQIAIADADVVLTHADVVLTHADVVLTHADVVLTHADVIAAAASAVLAAASAASVTFTIDTDVALTANSDIKVPSQKAIKAYADALIGAANAMVLKGTTDCSGNPNYPAADKGDLYVVSVGGKIGGASGVTVEAGDQFLCLVDGTLTGTQAGVGASWNIIQTNLVGAIVSGGALGTPSSGTLTNCTGLPVAGIAASTSTALGVGSIELGAAADTTISRAAAGVIAVESVSLYPSIPITSKSAAYTTTLADANTSIYHPSSDNNARTFTIDSNANVAYPVGTVLVFENEINTVTIAITADTLTMAGTGTTGSRTLGANGVACAHKVATTKWIINGTGLT